MAERAYVQRHVVIFDCNVYLDVARLLGSPYTQANFDGAVARLARVPVPHPTDSRMDSLRAIAACTSGRFAGSEPLEVWTSDHIDRMVRSQAMRAVEPEPETGFHGLAWSEEDAGDLVEQLVYGIVDASGGDTVGATLPDGEPPLDHEDGLVFGACRSLAGEDPLCKVYCVTNDVGFLTDYRAGRLSTHTYVLAPGEFLSLVRLARAGASMRRMPPPPPR